MSSRVPNRIAGIEVLDCGIARARFHTDRCPNSGQRSDEEYNGKNHEQSERRDQALE